VIGFVSHSRFEKAHVEMFILHALDCVFQQRRFDPVVAVEKIDELSKRMIKADVTCRTKTVIVLMYDFKSAVALGIGVTQHWRVIG
jgi:galactitol-specific phosphotransferase system IIB component